MNKVQRILVGISDSDLKSAVAELRERRQTGILCDGVVRRVAKQIQQEIGILSHDALQIAETNIIEIAAFKWAGIGPERQRAAADKELSAQGRSS